MHFAQVNFTKIDIVQTDAAYYNFRGIFRAQSENSRAKTPPMPQFQYSNFPENSAAERLAETDRLARGEFRIFVGRVMARISCVYIARPREKSRGSMMKLICQTREGDVVVVSENSVSVRWVFRDYLSVLKI